jgi:hypothetical protein
MSDHCTCPGFANCKLHNDVQRMRGYLPNMQATAQRVFPFSVLLKAAAPPGMHIQSASPIIQPGKMTDFRAFPVLNLRVMQLALSTDVRAKLSIELRLRNTCYEFGAIDTWKRSDIQKRTAYIKALDIGSVTPADQLLIRATNYGDKPTSLFAQVDCLSCMTL